VPQKFANDILTQSIMVQNLLTNYGS